MSKEIIHVPLIKDQANLIMTISYMGGKKTAFGSNPMNQTFRQLVNAIVEEKKRGWRVIIHARPKNKNDKKETVVTLAKIQTNFNTLVADFSPKKSISYEEKSIFL